MTENFPNLAKEIDTQAQEAQRVPNKRNPKRPTTRPIIIKMPKVKDKETILKVSRENICTLCSLQHYLQQPSYRSNLSAHQWMSGQKN